MKVTAGEASLPYSADLNHSGKRIPFMFLSKAKLIALLAIAVLAVPATAFATHSWPDVADDRFYTEAVEWAKGNGMTTGCDGGANFCPDRSVSRGENITFAKRYDDLVVQPALTEITTTHNEEVGRLAYEQWDDEDDWDGSPLLSEVTIDAPVDGFLLVTYTTNLSRDSDQTGAGDVEIEAVLDHNEASLGYWYQQVSMDATPWADSQSLAITEVIPVMAGSHLVQVELTYSPTTGQLVYVEHERLSVFFVRFGVESGLTPLGGSDR